MKRLPTAKEVEKFTARGRYACGHGLYLQVSEWGTRSWIFRYQRDGRAVHLGLGSVIYVPLATARDRAFKLRQGLIAGADPLEAKRAERAAAQTAAIKTRTFRECAEAYIAAHEAGWRNGSSSEQWLQSLRDYVFPKLGVLPVGDIDTALVLSVLEPIWKTRTETASRVRGRIESILDWAKTRGLRSGENPARWRGHLENLLPAPSKVRRVQHYAALSYTEMSSFVVDLRRQAGIAARALEFLILTATRAGEVMDARWPEIDLAQRAWVVPGSRMKTGKEHRVPLSDRAIEILEQLPRESEHVFPGRNGGALSGHALLRVLERMNRGETVHGFRSSFRDWAAEETNYPNHVVEMALAHAISGEVEKAYRRGNLFEKRRRLMDDWARYCSQPTTGKGEVVTLRKEA
jgi:integrase